MIFTATWTGDDAKPIVICKTNRNWLELDPRLNHTRVIDVVQFYQADFAKGFDRGNRRNIFSFNVWRAVDNAAQAFKDPAAALLFACDHPQSFTGHGTLTIAVQETTAGSRILDDCLLTGIEMVEKIGVMIAWRYTFNGGEFKKSKQATP